MQCKNPLHGSPETGEAGRGGRSAEGARFEVLSRDYFATKGHLSSRLEIRTYVKTVWVIPLFHAPVLAPEQGTLWE